MSGSADDCMVVPDNLLAALDLARHDLAVFPIRDWGDGEGWKPIKGWQARASADPAQVAAWWEEWPEARVGLLAGERNGITVLDLDTKNGKDGIASLFDLGFPDVAALSPVRVRTPSGGWHLYFRHDPRVKNWAGKLGPGIDIKTEGGLVIAPGSCKDGKRYEPEGQPLGTCPLPAFPEALVTQPATDVADDDDDWGIGPKRATADEEQIRLLLPFIDSGDHDTWIAVGMHLRDLLGAGGFDIWDEWSRASPNYGGTDRWRSFKEGGNPGRAFGALKKMARAGGWTGRFPDADVARLNARHAFVNIAGRSLIATERRDGGTDFGTVRDFHLRYANDLVPKDKDRWETVSAKWLRSTDRREFLEGVIFAPGGAPSDMLNLWRGWAVEPNPKASCSRFLEHVREIVCGGNPDHAAYVLGWLAHMVQRPQEKPGVAIVLRGPKGAGKDTVREYVARMIGERHAPTVAQSEHIVGRFNARLESALLLHVQEGSWAGDHKAEEVLKYLVSSSRVEIERKGIDSINLPSVLRLFTSANAEWVVPASRDERRWAVFEVSDNRTGDDEYFRALRAEMHGEGPAALLHYLRSYDLSGFNVHKAPETEGLRNQKLASLRGIHRWWFEVLHSGEIGTYATDHDGDWEAEPLTVGCNELRNAYVTFMRARRYDGEALDGRAFGKQLRDMLPDAERKRHGSRNDRSWVYVLPPMPVAREHFTAWLRAPVDWEAEQ